MAFRIPLVDLAADYAEVGPALEEAVLRVLRSGRYVLGPETERFEREFAALVGASFAVGVGSGTEALGLALHAVGVGPGDEVVLPAFTFFATVEAVRLCGAVPIFADIEREGFGLDPSSFRQVLSERTRAVVPVHLFGRCADMVALTEIAEAHGVSVVEDAAQATGAARGGRRAGAWGRAASFSFYPAKHLGAAGDGGGITTSDPEIAARLRLLRSHGLAEDGQHHLMGTTSRLDALQAAVLRAKLPYLKAWIDGRARNARIYADALDDCPGITLPAVGAGEECVWNQYTIRCREPERVRRALDAAGVEWRHYYPRPVCCEPALGEFARPASAFPAAQEACREVLSIPVRGSCAPSEIQEVAHTIRRAVGGSNAKG